MAKTPRRKKQSPRPRKDPYVFEAIELGVGLGTNHDWALTHLPNVRLAFATVEKDHIGVAKAVWTLLNDKDNDNLVGEMLDRWRTTREHLGALVDIIGAAEARTALTLKRMEKEDGYHA